MCNRILIPASTGILARLCELHDDTAAAVRDIALRLMAEKGGRSTELSFASDQSAPAVRGRRCRRISYLANTLYFCVDDEISFSEHILSGTELFGILKDLETIYFRK